MSDRYQGHTGPVARMMSTFAVLAVFLVTGFLFHLILWVATGRIYYQLEGLGPLLFEAGRAAWTIVVLLAACALAWGGLPEVLRRLQVVWSPMALAWGMSGAVTALALAWVATKLLGEPIGYATTLPSRSRATVAAALLHLFVLVPASEELLFRGLVQTHFIQTAGSIAGVGTSTLLFGLWHLPSDIYFGRLRSYPLQAWACRWIQLYAGGMILGMAVCLSGTLFASLFMHQFIILAAFVVFPYLERMPRRG